MPELHDIAVRAIELANNRIQAGFGVALAGWKLEEPIRSPRMSATTEIPDQGFGPLEPFHMGYELAHLYRVYEFSVARLTPPGLNVRDGRPGIKGRVKPIALIEVMSSGPWLPACSGQCASSRPVRRYRCVVSRGGADAARDASQV